MIVKSSALIKLTAPTSVLKTLFDKLLFTKLNHKIDKNTTIIKTLYLGDHYINDNRDRGISYIYIFWTVEEDR